MPDPPQRATVSVTVDPSGSTSVLRAEPPQGPAPDIPRLDRAAPPILTGFYESMPPTAPGPDGAPQPTRNSSRMLQLNQAGRALVGWFTPPPDFADHDPFPVAHAVLVADLTVSTDNGHPFFYRIEVPKQAAKDHQGYLTHDPSWVLSPDTPWPYDTPPTEILRGTLKRLNAVDDLSLTFFARDGSSASLTFMKAQSRARLSNRLVLAQPPDARSFYRIYHQQPLPRSFFMEQAPSGHFWAAALHLFTNADDNPLAQHIRDFVQEWDKTFTFHARLEQSVVPRIRELLRFVWELGDYPHKTLLNNMLGCEANHNTLTVARTHLLGSSVQDTRSFADWLAWIGQKEDERKREFPPEFRKLLAGPRVYRIRLAFEAWSQDKGGSFGLSAGAGAFLVTVSMTWAPRDSEGKLPPPDSDKWTSEDLHFQSSVLGGVFFELKQGEGGIPGLPDKIDLYSATSFTPAQFQYAFMFIYEIEASAAAKFKVSVPFVSTGASVSTGGRTFLLHLHVQNEVLEGIYDNFKVTPELKWPTKAKFDASPKSLERLKKLLSGAAEAQDIFDYTKSLRKAADIGLGAAGGAGLIVPLPLVHLNRVPWKAPNPQAVEGDLLGEGAIQTAPPFEFDHWTLDRSQNGWKTRFLFETVLATDLAVFSGAPYVDLRGYASPEGTFQYNRALSEKRAWAIRYAIEDALGQPLPDEITDVRGEGEMPSWGEAGNPPEDPAGEAAFEHDHQEQVATWPHWRKVDVNVSGRLALRVLTVTGAERK